MTRYVVMVREPNGRTRIVANVATKKRAEEIAEEQGPAYFVRPVGKRKKTKKKKSNPRKLPPQWRAPEKKPNRVRVRKEYRIPYLRRE